MSSQTKLHPVSIKILGKDYRVACSTDEQETLMNSAQELDEQMKEIRDSSAVNGTDKIAVMAALNLTHELKQVKQLLSGEPEDSLSYKLAKLRLKIENVLDDS